MRNYVIINGVNSLDIQGLAINTLPPITKPMIRTQREEIDGRDGDIITELGYSAYDKQMEIGLYGNYDINDIISYFTGEGTIVFSNEDDKYYYFKILDQIDYEKLLKFKTATIKFHCQPFKYLLEETPVNIEIETITASGENLDLNNTAEAQLTLSLKGNTSQNGNPTPSTPIEVETTTGSQIIDIIHNNFVTINDIEETTINGITYSIKDGLVSMNGTATNPVTIYTTKKFNLGAGTYTYSYEKTNGSYTGTIGKYLRLGTTMIFDGGQLTSWQTRTIDSYIGCVTSLFIAKNVVCNNLKFYLKLNKGSSVLPYEPYKGKSYEINLGKNLLPNNMTDYSSSGITATKNEDGSVTINGTSTANQNIYLTYNLKVHKGTYTLSLRNRIVGVGIYFYVGSSLNAYISATATATTFSSTFTLNSDTEYSQIRLYIPSGYTFDNVTVYPMLEKGSATTSYSPYKTPIELCKIGDYQDRIYKNNGKWYLEKQIGRYGIDTTKITLISSYSNIEYANIPKPTDYAGYNLYDHSEIKSNSATWMEMEQSGWNTSDNINKISGNADKIKWWLGIAKNTGLDTIKSELDGSYILYPLATATTTEITDNELINQLEATLGAKSYDTITHIIQSTANKPFILDVVAVQKGSDIAIVDNEGNIYSKPTIEIEGTGIAEIYLNGNQMFSIDLSTINECVLDIANLEAYNPTTTILMNRKVTGDYSKFMLNPGENQIKIDGAVTKATISNYTRWL